MTNYQLDYKKIIDKAKQEIESSFQASEFVLNEKTAAANENYKKLIANCPHSFDENGNCEICGISKESI